MRGLNWVVPVVLVVTVIASFSESRAEDKGGQARVIQVTAEKFKFTPSAINLKLGEPVVLELTSLDRKHGFNVPDFKIDETIEPGKVSRVKLVPDKTGTFSFHCDIFCGSGHEEMAGEIVVSP